MEGETTAEKGSSKKLQMTPHTQERTRKNIVGPTGPAIMSPKNALAEPRAMRLKLPNLIN